MISPKYKKYLKSEKWKAKRREALAIHGRQCYACGKRRGPMHCHHLTYERLGNENAKTDFMILCPQCHDRVSKFHRRNRHAGLRKNTYYMVKVIRKGLIQ